jgi:hypothetical protein
LEGDISNKTIVVLVVLTVLISVLSTLVILNEITGLDKDAFARMQGGSSGASTGKVEFEIKERPSSTTGLVLFEIRNGDG